MDRFGLVVFSCVAAAVVAGCGGGSSATSSVDMAPAPCTGTNEQGAVVTKFSFALQSSPGVSVGFSLAHHVSAAGDPVTCGHPTFVTPDGTPGINNQVSTLLPTINAMTGGALDGLVQAAINNGMLLIGIDFTKDDNQQNSCVDLTFEHVTGTPTVGTDGVLDANQTFTVATDVAPSHVQGIIKNGVLTAGPFELLMPVLLLNANFDLHVHGAYVSTTIAADGSMTGVLGGGVETAELTTDLSTLAIGDDVQAILPSLLMGAADLAKNPNTGDCDQISTAININARSAFFNP